MALFALHYQQLLFLVITMYNLADGNNQPLTNHSLQLQPVSILDHNASLRWSGLDLSRHDNDAQSPKCSVSYGVINSTERTVRADYIPRDHLLELTGLQAKTTYDLYLSCSESENEVYKSQTFVFTTAEEGETVVIEVTPLSKLYTDSPGVTTTRPEVEKEKVSADQLNPVDIAVGVLFGAIALAILFTVLYYVMRKVRRQQRIRRFIQYRQQENDPFPGLEDREDDDIHI